MMGIPARLTEADFIREFESIGPQKLADKYALNVRAVFKRRKYLEGKYQRQITPPDDSPNKTRSNIEHPQRIEVTLRDGVVMVGGDAHYWPGYVSTAHRAFVHFAKKLKPAIIILNGDMVDGAAISRHPPMNWENVPDVVQEIETVQERTEEIRKAAPNAKRYWPLGNHDARYEARLATVAPQYAKVHGMHLKDHFPWWEPCYAVWINGNVVVKHRYKGGTHATHNNTVQSGKTIVTNHLHSQKVTPWSDYTGTRWGVDTGTLADPYGPQFLYQEDNPRNHRSGFAVLTFRDGRLTQPETVMVTGEGEVDFRGEFHRV